MGIKTSWRYLLLTLGLLVGCIASWLWLAGLRDTTRILRTTGADLLLKPDPGALTPPRMLALEILEPPDPEATPEVCISGRQALLPSAPCPAEDIVPAARVEGRDLPTLGYHIPVPAELRRDAPNGERRLRNILRVRSPALADRAGQQPYFHLVSVKADGTETLDLEGLPDGRHSRLALDRGLVLDFAPPFASAAEVDSLASAVSARLASWDNRLSNTIITLLFAALGACPIALFIASRHMDFALFVPAAWRRHGNPSHPLAALEQDISSISAEDVAQGKGAVEDLQDKRRDLIKLADEMPATQGSPIGGRCYLREVMRATIDQWGSTGRTPIESFEPVLDEVADRHESDLSLSVLDHIAVASPVLGFMGTAVGMAKAFEQMDGARLGMNSEFSTAMKVALATTILGLMARFLAQLCIRVHTLQLDRRLGSMHHNVVRWAVLFDRIVALEFMHPDGGKTRKD